MIQNRFFKTTTGVAFELSGGKAQADTIGDPNADPVVAPVVTNLQTFIDNPVLGNYAAFLDNKTKDALKLGVALTSAQAKEKVFFSYISSITGGKGNIRNTSPLLAGSIRATLVAYKAPALQDAKIVKAGGTPLATQEVAFKVIETTPGNSPMPIYDYSQVIVTDFSTALTAIAAAANADKDNDWFTATKITDGIQVVSKDASRHFRLAMTILPSRSQPIDDVTFTYTVNTAAFAGSGTVEQIKALENEDDIRNGVTTQYPGDGFSPDDFGSPVRISDISGSTTYDIVSIVGLKSEDSPTPVDIHKQHVNFFIVVPSGQGAAIVTTFA